MDSVVFPRPSGEEQARAVLDTEQAEAGKPLKPGDRQYLISNRWFTSWCRHSGFAYNPAETRKPEIRSLVQPGPEPGPVDNSDLLAAQGDASAPLPARPDLSAQELQSVAVLRPGLLDKQDFWIVSEPTWSLFTQWYGVASGHEIVRQCFLVRSGTQAEIDVYQLHVKACLEGTDRSAIVAVPRECFVSILKSLCCEALQVDGTDYDLVEYRGKDAGSTLEEDLSKMCRSAGILDLQAVLLRPKVDVQEDVQVAEVHAASPVETMALMSTSPGLLLPHESPRSRSFTHSPPWAEDIVHQNASMRAGLAGLGNLGNTCFMNSSLQCLSHTVPILSAFLSGDYKDDVNLDNPLGLGGKLAQSFGALLHKLWQGGVAFVAPKHFKWQLSVFAPQFGGYAQQDSQELLAFLLDGLHEDLNRIKEKPYIEDNEDDEPQPDDVAAGQAWVNYRARNDSIIVDHFQGLYKSTLVCPTCDHKSVKFDPFMYLSLPLPSTSTRTFKITVIAVGGEAPPTQYAVEVAKSSTVRQLCDELANVAGISDGSSLLLAQLQSHGKLDILLEEAHVADIQDSRRFNSQQLVAYAYHGTEYGPSPGKSAVLVSHKLGKLGDEFPSLFHFSEGVVKGAEPVEAADHMDEEGGDNATLTSELEAALDRLLRPFRKPLHTQASKLQQQGATSIPATGDGTSRESGAEEDQETAAAACQEECGQPLPPISESASGASSAFDMFSLQSSGQGLPGAGWDSQIEQASRASFVLRRAPNEGRGRFDFGPRISKSSAERLSFVAEWQQEAAQYFDSTPMTRPRTDESVVAQERRAAEKNKKVALDDCMRLFLHPEQLGVDDSWYCCKCQDHVQAIKKLDLWTLPEVLVVHLKRFSYSRVSRDKLDVHVEFPLEGLDLSNYLQLPQENAPVYDLFAVSNHYGGLGGGHYTACCKMPDDNHWYNFDDSHVHSIDSLDDLQSPAAYVLFYRRQGSPQGFLNNPEDISLDRPIVTSQAQPGEEETATPIDLSEQAIQFDDQMDIA